MNPEDQYCKNYKVKDVPQKPNCIKKALSAVSILAVVVLVVAGGTGGIKGGGIGGGSGGGSSGCSGGGSGCG